MTRSGLLPPRGMWLRGEPLALARRQPGARPRAMAEGASPPGTFEPSTSCFTQPTCTRSSAFRSGWLSPSS